MCEVSMVGDHYRERWNPMLPHILPQLPHILPQQPSPFHPVVPQISREEFDALKREVMEMKDLLKRAKEYDARTGQAECETDEKMAVLRKVAEFVGISLDDLVHTKKSLKPATKK